MIEKKIADLVSHLSECFPHFKPSGATSEVWQKELGEFSSEQLMRAARYAMERSPDFAPSTAAIRTAILGRIVRVPVHATDNFNCVIMPPRVMDSIEVRVLPGASTPGWVAEGTELPKGVVALEQPKEQPRLTE